MALAQQSAKPNIVVIFGDDIGMWNVGAYIHGMMGRTPNIDRIAREGILPIRTGMTTVGIPGSKRGIQKEDPRLAEVLKSLGYATAQFGKNHLRDRNEFLPTAQGADTLSMTRAIEGAMKKLEDPHGSSN